MKEAESLTVVTAAGSATMGDETHLLFDSEYWDSQKYMFRDIGNDKYLWEWSATENGKFYYSDGYIRQSDVLFVRFRDGSEGTIAMSELIVYAIQDTLYYETNDFTLFFLHIPTGTKYYLRCVYNIQEAFFLLQQDEMVDAETCAFQLEGHEEQIIDEDCIEYYNSREIKLSSLLMDDTWESYC